MAKYRRKPLIVEDIEASVYREGMEDGFEYDCNDVAFNCGDCIVYATDCDDFKMPYIETPEGNRYVYPDDYIITFANGERRICKPDIFKMTYEKIERVNQYKGDKP